jgi:hypothetical protein
VKATPTSLPLRWNGRNPTAPGSRARLSLMIDVDALRNASIKSGAGFGTLSIAMVTLMQTVPPQGFLLFADIFHSVKPRRSNSFLYELICPNSISSGRLAVDVPGMLGAEASTHRSPWRDARRNTIRLVEGMQ